MAPERTKRGDQPNWHPIGTGPYVFFHRGVNCTRGGIISVCVPIRVDPERDAG